MRALNPLCILGLTPFNPIFIIRSDKSMVASSIIMLMLNTAFAHACTHLPSATTLFGNFINLNDNISTPA